MKWISKILDVSKLIRRIWLILWVTLFLLVIMKLLFNEWYPIVVDNPNIINIFLYIDNNYILDCFIRYLFYSANCYITYLTCCKKIKPNKIEFILIPILSAISFIVKTFINNYLAFLIEMLMVIVLPIIIKLNKKTFKSKKFNILFPIVINLLLMLWQCNMLFIRNIELILTKLPTSICYILQIDYYIFLIITWIGVRYFMGNLGLWFWGNSLTKLQAMKEEELKKEKPDMEFIKQIDEAIAKKKNETKD